MSRRAKSILVILALVAIVSFSAWPIYKKIMFRQASAALQARTQALVDKNPQLKADWDKAMEDGALSIPEANAILEKAGEKPDPE